MPRPVFDIAQYELRGHTPEVYTRNQKRALAKTLARANGQIDWASQLLGFHGEKTWGRSAPTNEGEYNWDGLPSTMHEKRQLQVGAFGVFNKNLPYESWPSPFNRSAVNASADATISIFEENGLTVIAPYGQRDLVDYSHDPVLYNGGEYEFNNAIEVTLAGDGEIDDYLEKTKFWVADQEWTRIRVLQRPVNGFVIKIVDSKAAVLLIPVLEWTDSSDWNVDRVRRQFLGVWGNKAATLSLDFSFDALDLHGFDEKNALSKSGPVSVTPELLLWSVGLKPTIWTPFETDNFGFKFGSCATAYPDAPLDENYILLPQTHTFSTCQSDCEHLVEMRQMRSTENEDCDFRPGDLLGADPIDFILTTDPNLLELEIQTGECPRTPEFIPGIERFEFEYFPLNDCAKLGTPCFEWIWDPKLDNGDWDAQYYLPENPGPWAAADDGVFDRPLDPPPIYASQSLAACDYDKEWIGFDDGEYDQVLSPNCEEPPCVIGDKCFCVDLEGGDVYNWRSLPSYDTFEDGGIIRVVGPCQPADSGWMDTQVAPDFDDNDCATECSILENGTIVSGETIYNGPIIVSGGLFPLDPAAPNATTLMFCVTDTMGLPANYIGCDADNCIYDFYSTSDGCDPIDGWYYAAGATPNYGDCDCLIECCGIDNEYVREDGFVYTGPELADSGWYNYPDKTIDPTASGTACPLDPVRVDLTEGLRADDYKMQPSLRNSTVPLRIWKSQVLTVTDDVPATGTEFWNYLVADENRGCQADGDYRYYVRLPLEYQRNGKQWNRAVSVCDNQSYFSALPEVSQAHDVPQVIRPVLYAETYWQEYYQDFVTYYDEDYLVSTFHEDSGATTDPDFEDSQVSFELDTPLPYSFASMGEYDPFDLRAPNLDGSWRGEYYVNGVNPHRTGVIEVDTEAYNLIRLSKGQEPIYDKSPLDLPTIDFPDTPAKASFKNYVVGYAYFVTDFSAADDAVFDPEKQQCWRSPVIYCNDEPDCGDPANSQVCETAVPTTVNTAYRLHEYGSSPLLLK